MTAVRKRRQPANDLHPLTRKNISFAVRTSRSFWRGRRVAAAFVFVLFFALMGLFAPSFDPEPSQTAAHADKTEPFDIRIDDAAPAVQDKEAAAASQKKRSAHPAFTVEVRDDLEPGQPEPGGLAEALRAQRRVVEADPLNMKQRWALAVLHDRAADREGAAVLYRQVVDAYDAHDETLPSGMDIDALRQRLMYLESMAPR